MTNEMHNKGAYKASNFNQKYHIQSFESFHD